MDPVEWLRTAGEIGARQIWFRLPEALRSWLATRVRRGTTPAPVVDLDRVAERIDALVPRAGGLLMVHASADGFRIRSESSEPSSGARSALLALELLLRRVGDTGTLCMPTHPLYKGDRGFLEDKSDLRLVYRPQRTPSSMGLLSEFFRRDSRTQRSAHPLSSLAARGPRADELLRGNLNERAPLPHGVDSGYYRFCRAGGSVLGIGLRLLPFATVLHCAEESADEAWPVPDFFRLRHFVIEDVAGARREVRVRERRPEFVRALALGRLRRDALAEGLLRETDLDGVPIDVLDAKGLLEMMIARQRRGPYPFVLPGLAVSGTARPAATTMD